MEDERRLKFYVIFHEGHTIDEIIAHSMALTTDNRYIMFYKNNKLLCGYNLDKIVGFEEFGWYDECCGDN